MKYNPGSRRPRSRGSNNNSNNNNNTKRQGGGRSNFESNGPDVKVRGTAQQVYEKYAVLARDAFTSGDRMIAESYFQYAEHYHRVMSAAEANNPQARPESQPNAQSEQPRHGGNRQEHTISAAPVVTAAPAVPVDQPALLDEATVERKNPPVAAVPMTDADELPEFSEAVAVEAISDNQPALVQTPAPAPKRRRSRTKPQPSPDEVVVADTKPAPV